MLSLEFGPEPGQISVTFTSVEGGVYAIQRSSDMTATATTPGSWEELTDDLDGEGETTTFIDTSPPAGARRLFYRAIRVE